MAGVVKTLEVENGMIVTGTGGTVNLSDMSNMNTNRLLGRSTSGSGIPEELSVGTGLSLSGGTLSCTVSSITYTEGTWTPNFGGTDSASIPVGSSITYTGRYTRIGRTVKFIVQISTTGSATTTGSAGTTACDLPIAPAQNDACYACNITTGVGLGTGAIKDSDNQVYPPSWSTTGNTIVISGTYEV